MSILRVLDKTPGKMDYCFSLVASVFVEMNSL